MHFNKDLKPIKDFPNYTVDIYGRVFNLNGSESHRQHHGYHFAFLVEDNDEL